MEQFEPDEVRPNETRVSFQERINEFRANHSRKALSTGPRLVDIATEHSKRMARDGFEHGDSGARLRSAGCSGGGGENIAYTYLRENINQEYETLYIDSADDLARALYLQWYHSPPHRDIMLSEGADRAGLGLYVTDEENVFATLDIC